MTNASEDIETKYADALKRIEKLEDALRLIAKAHERKSGSCIKEAVAKRAREALENK